MQPPTLDAFRDLVDERGLLRSDAVPAMEALGVAGDAAAEAAFTVFSQRADAYLDGGALERHGAAFFGARLGLTVTKRYGPSPPPAVDAALVVVAAGDGPGETRLCFGRPREAADLDAAHRAEAAQGGGGLVLVAERCKTVWIVAAAGPDDRTALLLGAVLSTVLHGPILPPGRGRLYGVRTARIELEGARAPSR